MARDVAPDATVSASSNTTFNPALASAYAVAHPVSPAPITTTSAVWSPFRGFAVARVPRAGGVALRVQ